MNGKPEDSRYIILGRISGLYGVKGWVKVYSETSPRDNILSYPVWYLNDGNGWQTFQLQAGRTHGKGVVAHLEHCPDRDAAAMLVGREIAIPRDSLPELDDAEYYWADLVGLRVINLEETELGQVSHLMQTGANDVLVVKQGKKERLIPFIQPQVIRSIDLEQGLISVDWDADF